MLHWPLNVQSGNSPIDVTVFIKSKSISGLLPLFADRNSLYITKGSGSVSSDSVSYRHLTTMTRRRLSYVRSVHILISVWTVFSEWLKGALLALWSFTCFPDWISLKRFGRETFVDDKEMKRCTVIAIL